MPNPNHQQWQQPYPGSAQPSVKRTKPGRGLMIVGGILVVVAIIVAVVGFVGGLTFAIPDADEVQRVDGSLKIQLGDAEERTVWAPEGSDVECRVLDESGEAVDLRRNGSTRFENEKGSFVSIGKFAGEGEYTIECRNGVGAVSPSLGVWALLGGIGSFVLGAFLGFAGFVIFCVGLVVRLTNRRGRD